MLNARVSIFVLAVWQYEGSPESLSQNNEQTRNSLTVFNQSIDCLPVEGRSSQFLTILGWKDTSMTVSFACPCEHMTKFWLDTSWLRVRLAWVSGLPKRRGEGEGEGEGEGKGEKRKGIPFSPSSLPPLPHPPPPTPPPPPFQKPDTQARVRSPDLPYSGIRICTSKRY